MSEAKQPKYEMIPKNFNGKEIDFISKKGDVWITAETLGIGLEYKNPRISVMKLYYSHQDEIEEYKGVIELVTPGGIQETTVFNEMGAYLLIMFSNQPKAKEFRKWVVNVIKEIRKTGVYIEKIADPYDLMVQQADMIKKAFIDLKNQNKRLSFIENQVNSVDTELKSFEQKYEDEKIITSQTKRRIADIVNTCHTNSGLHWGFFHSKYKQAFGISSYKDISEKLGQKIIKWMENNPLFLKFLNKDKEV